MSAGTTVQVRVLDADVDGPKDAKGKATRAPITSAEVALAAKGPATEDPSKWPFAALAGNCPHKADGGYEPAAAPAAGEHLLVVRAAGKNPVVQRLTFTAGAGGALTAKAGWAGGDKDLNRRAANVTVTSEAVKGKAASVTITVTLSKAAEIIILAGTEYHGAGTQWHLFARGRRDLYYKAGRLRAGDVCTLVLAESDERLNTVKAAEGGWLVAGRRAYAAKTTGVVQFYEYVHETGGRAPGSVIELSIISHAWMGGPIIRDTYDRSGSATARDPNDTDGRTKDFLPGGVVPTKFPKFVAALHADAIFKMWGCSATTVHLRAQNAAYDARKAKKPDTAFFEIAYEETRESLSSAHVRHMIADVFANSHFAAAVCSHVPRKIIAAPPGLGSNFGTQGGVNVNYVDQVVAPHKKVYTYLQEVFGAGAKPDAEGYIDYSALYKHVRATPALLTKPPFSTERWERTKGDVYLVLRLPTRAQVIGPKLTTTFAVEAKKDLVTPGKAGHLYAARRTKVEGLVYSGASFGLFLASSPTGSTGIFVQEDGKVFLMKPDAKGAWVLDKTPAPEMVKGATGWAPSSLSSPIDHQGTLQTASPAAVAW